MIVLLVIVVYFLIDSTLAGHVTIGHICSIGGNGLAVHQFASVGNHAICNWWITC